jgi:cAMP-dependent protein kinase regulator
MEKQQYLDTVVKPIMENIVFQLVCERPENPAEFIINSLMKSANISTDPLSKTEKHELKKLRKQIYKYRKLEPNENKQNYKEDSEEEQDVVKEVSPQKQVVTTTGKQKHRSGVSAEAYGTFNPKKDFVPKFIKKNEDQIQRIKNKILQSFIFSNVEPKDVNVIIDAMEEKIFQDGEHVIKQGENGECLYIIESGDLDCFKRFTVGGENKFLKTYHPGESFGELALLYNAPRAASIVSKTKSILWALDRETFNNIVKESARKMREQYETFLKSCEVFSSVDTYELGQICDALKPCYFKEGDFVIKEVIKSYIG